jgi:hypothetical protein
VRATPWLAMPEPSSADNIAHEKYPMKSMMSLLQAALALSLVAWGSASAQISASGYTLVSSQRVGRTTWDYTYSVQFTNKGQTAFGISATVTSSAPSTVIVKGDLSVGDLAAGASTAPSGTITIQQDRTVQFTFKSLVWNVKATRTVTGITLYSNPSDSRFGTIHFDNGDSYEISGDKSSTGQPLAIRAVTALEDNEQYDLGYAPTGELTSAGIKGGFVFSFGWTAGQPTSVALTTPSGTTVRAALAFPKSSIAAHANLQGGIHPAADSDPQETCGTEVGLLSEVCDASERVFENPVGACTIITQSIIAAAAAAGQLEVVAAYASILGGCVALVEVAEQACTFGKPISAETVCNAIEAIVSFFTTTTVKLNLLTPGLVNTGGSITLSWVSTNATACVGSGGNGSDQWAGPWPLFGLESITENTPGTYTYTMTCSTDTQSKNASVTVTVGNPWVGAWDGNITSTCGFISGPFDIVIVSAGGNVLNLTDEYGDAYSLTISSTNPNAASSTLNGGIYYTISGNSMTVSEPSACQTGSLTRQ